MSIVTNRKVWPAASIAVLLAIVFVPRPADAGLWLHTLFEWLHVPIFGLISLALLALMPKSWPTSQAFGLALLGAVLLGVFSEAIQIPMRRDASWEDIIANGVGAAGFLLVAYAVGRKPVVATMSVFGALAILIGSASPVISVTNAIVHRNSQFPVIFNGDIESERTFVSGRNVSMETRWSQSPRRPYTRVETVSGHGPRIEIRNLMADWSNYSNLSLDMEVEGEQDMEFTVRIHDKLHRRGNQPHSDRFNQRFTLRQGRNNLDIPLQDVRDAPHGRSMDMTDIEALVIFSNEDYAERVIKLYEIRLN